VVAVTTLKIGEEKAEEDFGRAEFMSGSAV
jgi:hypothetical protein